MSSLVPALRGPIVLAGLVGLVVVLAGLSAEHATARADVVVHVEAGAVMGHDRASDVAFLGIPYAQPPVGPLRWRLPLPHLPWDGTLDAARPGSVCPQPVTSAGQPASSEDCLFLNVYAPRPSGAGRPVMVWIHGGTNTTGAGSFYDPGPLVASGGVVAVTLNYRLGAFGFLAHPALAAEQGTTGSYGLADQQLALRWVRANIAAFGGDPANVTVFGESSGGLNVLSQLASPGAAGLFDRAIVQSGAFLLDTPSLADSEARGTAFAQRLGCADQSAACLRGKSTAEVLDGQGNPSDGTAAYAMATVDGAILPSSQRAAFEAGRFDRVPVMVGNNGQEGRLFVPPDLSAGQYAPTLESLAEAAGRSASGVLQTYPVASYPTPALGAAAAFGDSTFACTDLALEHLLDGRVPTYSYEFDDVAGDQAPLGPTHGSELKYLFGVTGLGSVLDGDPAGLPEPSRALSGSMRQYWTVFARSGVPQADGLPVWAPATSGTLQRLASPRASAEAERDFEARHRCSFWNGSADAAGKTAPAPDHPPGSAPTAN